MNYFQYLGLKSLLFVTFIFIVLLMLCKALIKNKLRFSLLRKRALIIFGCGVASYCGFYGLEYIRKIQQFEMKQIRSDVLMTQLIYSVRKDRPYTVYESSLSRTNDKIVLDNIRGNEVIPNNEYKRSFNLAKRALLDIEKKSLYKYSSGIHNPDICQKDKINQLYRCQSRFKKPNGAKVYLQAIVYAEPKAYQDYLRFGFHEKSPL
ncbi:MAG: hypothetical protein ACRCXK_03605 [Wohlfahrtiimonas sp.]